jgi:hypothetical protein
MTIENSSRYEKSPADKEARMIVSLTMKDLESLKTPTLEDAANYYQLLLDGNLEEGLKFLSRIYSDSQKLKPL